MKIPETDGMALPFLLRPSNRSDLKFQGAIAAEVSSENTRVTKPKRWHELIVYRTSGGNIVVARVGCSTYPCESARWTVEVLGREPTEEQVVEFFGLSDLAKELYRLLGIECHIERVE